MAGVGAKGCALIDILVARLIFLTRMIGRFFFGRVGEEGCAHRYDGGVFWRVVWGGCGGGWR